MVIKTKRADTISEEYIRREVYEELSFMWGAGGSVG